MQAIQTMPSLKRNNSLECTCEINKKTCKSKKCFTVCEICSEKKFLRNTSTSICSINDSFEM